MDSFVIEYKNEIGEVIKTDKILKVKRNKLNQLILLQEDLIYKFVKYNGAIGSIIADDACWDILKKLGKLFNVLGNEKIGINVEDLEDDLTQLTEIFFTQSLDDKGNVLSQVETFKPSKLSELHRLDYFNSIKKAVKKAVSEERQEETVI